MIDLKLTGSHDLALSSADLVGVQGAQCVAQAVKIALLGWMGEWFLDTEWGLPYVDRILVKGPDRARLEAIFRAKIKAVRGVRRVSALGLSIDPVARLLQVTASIIADDGVTAMVDVKLANRSER